MGNWKSYRLAGYEVIRTVTAHGYIPVSDDPDQAPVRRGRHGLYYETHHPSHRGKKLRHYIELKGGDS